MDNNYIGYPKRGKNEKAVQQHLSPLIVGFIAKGRSRPSSRLFVDDLLEPHHPR